MILLKHNGESHYLTSESFFLTFSDSEKSTNEEARADIPHGYAIIFSQEGCDDIFL